jgi:hypothetical protein
VFEKPDVAPASELEVSFGLRIFIYLKLVVFVIACFDADVFYYFIVA